MSIALENVVQQFLAQVRAKLDVAWKKPAKLDGDYLAFVGHVAS